MRKRLLAGIGMLAVVATACGSPGGTAASATRTAGSPVATTPAATAQPSPATFTPTSTANTMHLLAPASPPPPDTAQVNAVRCTGPIGGSDPVAVVQLHSGSWVMRDYANTAQPRTTCQLPYQAQLLDAHHLLMGGANYLYAVVLVPEVTVTWFQLPTPDQNPYLQAVSPNLDQIVYLTQDVANNVDRVHVVTSAGDAVITSLPNPHGGRCGSPEDSLHGDYTRSGSAMYVLNQPVPTLNSLVVVKGGQVAMQIAPQGQWALGAQPAMAVWSATSETLYYRQGGGVWRWTARGGAALFLPGVAWYYPTISADGAHLAYAAVRADGLHNVYLMDLAHGGSPQLIGKGARTTPVFLNASQLWYIAEQQGPCGPGYGPPLVYEIGDGSESASIVDIVSSVWPSTSSNF